MRQERACCPSGRVEAITSFAKWNKPRKRDLRRPRSNRCGAEYSSGLAYDELRLQQAALRGQVGLRQALEKQLAAITPSSYLGWATVVSGGLR